jgi:hypothetical protein
VDQAGSAQAVAGGDRPGAARGRRIAAPLTTAGSLLAATATLAVRDPHVGGSYGYCPFLLITGWQCPLCGGLRSVHDLTQGDVAAAVSSNLLVTAALPVLAGLWLLWARRAWAGRAIVRRREAPAALAYALTALLVAFTVVRNLPWGAALAA